MLSQRHCRQGQRNTFSNPRSSSRSRVPFLSVSYCENFSVMNCSCSCDSSHKSKPAITHTGIAPAATTTAATNETYYWLFTVYLSRRFSLATANDCSQFTEQRDSQLSQYHFLPISISLVLACCLTRCVAIICCLTDCLTGSLAAVSMWETL